MLAELCTGLSHLQNEGHILHQYMPKKIRGGFIANAKLVFLPPITPQKNAGLDCDEIGGCYEKYYVEQLLGNISPESVITVESAS